MTPREKRSRLTQADVHELLRYDPFTGELRWRRRARHRFKSDASWKSWNTRFAGKRAFTTDDGQGYRCGHIDSELHRAHRIAWLWQTGRWPENEIDHRDRNRSNNRWSNLREATNAENNRNQSLHSNNTTGFVGVARWGSKYRAHIRVDGKMINLGTFADKIDAAEARHSANRKYGFSPGHGRARLKRR